MTAPQLATCSIGNCTRVAMVAALCEYHDNLQRIPERHRPSTIPCGSHASYKRHLARREVPDPTCLAAEADYQRARREVRADVQRNEPPAEPGAYRGLTVCYAAQITYRQLDYWARTGLVQPSLCPAGGSGTQRLYSRDDIIRAACVRHLLDLGMGVTAARATIDVLLSHGHLDVTTTTGWNALRITLDPNAIARDVDHRLAEPHHTIPAGPVLSLISTEDQP